MHNEENKNEVYKMDFEFNKKMKDLMDAENDAKIAIIPIVQRLVHLREVLTRINSEKEPFYAVEGVMVIEQILKHWGSLQIEKEIKILT